MLALALLLPWSAGALLITLNGRRALIGWLAVAVLAGDLAVLAVLTARVLGDGPEQLVTGGWPAGVGIVLRADALGVGFAALSALVLLVAVAAEAVTGARQRAFPGLVVLLAGGLNGLFLTGDVFNFYVFFELSMTASYVLTAYGGGRRQLRAALVFTAVNLLGSFIFLISVAGVYRVTGSLTMADIAERIAGVDAKASLLVVAGFFIAFGVKLGLFPFHFWLPTVYAGARPAVAAILSGAVANIGAYGVLRFGAGLFPAELRLASVALIVIGAVSIVYGAALAISRSDPAEMLAYSAIGQVGYVLVAVGLGGPVGLAAAVLYSLVNSLNKALLFLTAGMRGTLVAGAFALGAFSVAGVPPAAGFVAKLAMFRAGIAAGSWAVVVVLLLGSVLSLIYLFQVYQARFWSGTAPGTVPPNPWPVRALTAALAILVLAAGLWPEPLLALSDRAAEALLSRSSG